MPRPSYMPITILCAPISVMSRSLRKLADPARDEVPGKFRIRAGKHFIRGAALDYFAAEHENHPVGDALSLRHIMCYDDDGVALFELKDEILDLFGRRRIERRTGLIHEDHPRLIGKRARQAQPLLLSAGKTLGSIVEPVLDLIPKPDLL